MSNWDLIFEEMEATQPAFGVSIRAALYCLQFHINFISRSFVLTVLFLFFLWVFPIRSREI